MGLTSTQHKKKMDAELAAALAAKPPTPLTEPDIITSRRRLRPDEMDQTPVREANAKQVEEVKAEIEHNTRLGAMTPQDFEREAAEIRARSEAAHHEMVRQLKVGWAKQIAAGVMPDFDQTDRNAREARAHQENLEFAKAELARSIHTEDYSG